MADPSDAYSFGQGSWITRSGLPDDYPRSCDTDGTGQYQAIGYYVSGVYCSFDYGSNWAQKTTGNEFRGTAYSRNGQYFLCASQNSGYMYKSTDYGSNVSIIATVIFANPQSVALSSNGQYMTGLGLASQIYTSSDYGSNWTARDSTRNWTGNSVSDNGEWQAACENAGQIYVSSNYGADWVARGSTDSYWFISISGTGQYMLAVAYSGYYYVSNNYGSNWTTLEFSGANPIFKDCWVSQTGKIMSIAARANKSVRISSNYGVTWTDSTSPTREWNGVAASDDGEYILGVHESVGTSNAMLSISPPNTIPPDAPTNVQVSSQTLIWTPPVQSIDLYRVYSHLTGTYTLRASTITSSIALSVFPINSAFEYAVTASNVDGESAYSALTSTIYIPPGAPTGITADGTDLSWTTPVGGADYYNLYINNTSNYVYYASTVSTAVAYSNLFIGSNIVYNVTANGNASGESAYSASSSAITVSFASVPDNSVNGSNYVDSLIGTGTDSLTLTETLQANASKFISPVIPAGEVDMRSIVNSNFIAPGYNLSSFSSSITTFLAISTGQTLVIPAESLPASNDLLYIPAVPNDTFTLSLYGKPYSFENSGVSSFSINGTTYSLGDTFLMGGRIFQYSAVGSLVLISQGFQLLPSTPSIYIRPRCTNQTIQYNWPTESVSSFSLVIEGYSTFALPYNTLSYTVPDLTNGVPYSAYLQQNDGNTSSFANYFRTVQPGNKPSIVPDITQSTLNTTNSTIQIQWTPPVSDGGATIGWYVFKDTVSTLKYNTYGTDVSITLPFVGYSSFQIQAVNDPGYGPKQVFTVTE